MRRQSQNLGFEIEVTEAQMEPWTFIQTPGNSASELRYLIQRCGLGVLAADQSNSDLIRLWGIEQLVEKFIQNEQTEEHQQMWELIQLINLQEYSRG